MSTHISKGGRKAGKRIDLAASNQSYLIYQTKVMRRYSALFQALNDSLEEDDVEVVSHLDPEYRAFCEEVLHLEAGGGKYAVGDRFTAGGMGNLFYADDQHFKRQCVMKVILPELREHDMIVRNFVREARITGQLEHPNIIPVHDLGYHEDYGLYFTMKLIEGQTLNEILQKLEAGNAEYRERYDLWALLNIFRKVCDAVAFAHSRQIMHRDIKPRNIMVGDYGAVLLMDWGLAKRIRRHRLGIQDEELDDDEADSRGLGEDTSALDGKVIKGSPGYMSPEQARGHSRLLDERSDIFLLGATLYNMLTYFPPYIGASIKEVLSQARKGEYPPLDQAMLGDLHVPKGLIRIIERAMAYRPRDRYQQVSELIEDLDNLIHGRMAFESRQFQAGEFLLREGEQGEECYLIESGEVEVYKMRGDKKLLLTTLGVGEIVGEMALLTHQERSATVRALQPTTVSVLNNESFQANLKKLPPWLESTVVTLAKRLYLTDRKLTDGP